MPAPTAPLTDLLGETRAQIVTLLRSQGRTVAALAEALGLSEVAVRRHLRVLEGDDLVHAETVRRDGPGRPGMRYALTDRAARLFPDRYAELAGDLLTYLEEEHGRSTLLEFLRWRSARQSDRYADVRAAGDAAARAATLADLLDRDGFMARVEATTNERGLPVLELRQGHCAVADVAAEHPEICAYEAALFRDLLGAKVSRRETIAGGANECVCTIVPHGA